MTYTEAERKADKRKGAIALTASIGVPPLLSAPQQIEQIKDPRGLKKKLMSMDGDDLVRATNRHYEMDAWDALSKITKNQDTKLEFIAAPNSVAMAPSGKYPGGRVLSGIPSRTVLAHELGHISRFKDPSVLRRAKALGIGSLLTPATYLLGTRLGLSDEQSLAGSSALSAGVMALNYRNRLREEFAASRNALRTLRAYNKTLTNAKHKVNIRAAKNTLKYALGTYKKAAIPTILAGALTPATLYGIHKLYKSNKKD